MEKNGAALEQIRQNAIELQKLKNLAFNSFMRNVVNDLTQRRKEKVAKGEQEQ